MLLVVHSVAALTWVGVYGYSLAEPPSKAGRAAAWVAFAVLVVSGMWAIVSADVVTVSPAVQVLLLFKITLALCSAAAGAVAMVASRARVRSAMTIAAIGLAAGAALLGFIVASAL